MPQVELLTTFEKDEEAVMHACEALLSLAAGSQHLRAGLLKVSQQRVSDDFINFMLCSAGKKNVSVVCRETFFLPQAFFEMYRLCQPGLGEGSSVCSLCLLHLSSPQLSLVTSFVLT